MNIYFNNKTKQFSYNRVTVHENNQPHLMNTELDWAESDLYNTKSVGNWLRIHVV
jgi:hypothetical protein